ncbi:hypothetical protein THRCLA_00181 [Thraustotheca clavata]|uniref:Large ribosomal subunit protein bL32m n=1 Tax=Thraustotheca clavata TaxID=74557 RepID=A0A1W0AC03_9STRA|nr:hypothetical protein THRCLA_00181 [Thraustotheca clavata]
MALAQVISSVRRLFRAPTFFPQVELLNGMMFEDDHEEEVNDALWLACPKSKVTPSRKKIRNNDPSKRLKNIVHLQSCEHCGAKKLRHRLCMDCFKKGTYFTS